MRLLKYALLFFIFTTSSVISADRSSLDYFRLSIEEIQRSFTVGDNIVLEQGAIGSLTQSQVNTIVNHAKKSLKYSKLVKDDDSKYEFGFNNKAEISSIGYGFCKKIK